MRRSTTEALLISLVLAAACGDDDEGERGVEEQRAEPTVAEPAAESGDRARESEAVPEARPQLALGATHGCDLSAQGTVRCWGSHRFGQLGSAAPALGPEVTSAEPVVVGGLDDAVRIAAGSFHTCAIRAGGEVVCWGHGGFGQLGVPGDDDHPEPVRVPLEEPAVEVAAGEGHTCARLASRRVACWGRNTFGQLGVAGEGNGHAPRVAAGLEGVVGLALGRDHGCALVEGGEVRCWGAGFEGQLGDGQRTERRHEPRAVPDLPPARAIASGSAHVCAILAEGPGGGTVRCWGRNDSGQVGDGAGGDPADVTASPVAVTALGDVVALAAGARHTCALREGGEVLCWGYNGFGQLGDGTEEPRPSPTLVDGVSDAREVAAGARHTCARVEGGAVRCWGRNHLAQLGRPTGDPALEPVSCCGSGQGS